MISGGLTACNGDTTVKKFVEPPIVSIESPPDGSILDEGVPIHLSGRVVDEAYGDNLTAVSAVWAINGTRVCPEAVFDAGGLISCDAIFSAGGARLTLSATNPDGQTAMAEVSLEVNVNNAPIAQILSPSADGVFYSDQTVLFEGVASDTESSSDQLEVVFSSDLDGDIAMDTSPASDGSIAGTSSLTPGDHLITMTVSDPTGRTGEDTVLIHVGGPNNPPDCGIDAPATGLVIPFGDTILFEGHATDADIAENLLSIRWLSNVDGEIGTSTASGTGDFFFGYSTLSAGVHTISLEVTDEVGALCNDAILVSVGNAPEIELYSPESGVEFNEGDDVIFDAAIHDVEDDPAEIDLVWESDIDGVISRARASSSGRATFTLRTLSPGMHALSLTATDSDGFTRRASSTIYINGVPSAPGVTISPASPSTSDTLRAEIATPAVDPEGSALTYLYQWYKNGDPTGYTSNTVPSSALQRGEYWAVEVRATDGVGTGLPGTAEVLVGNGAPSLASVAITPSVAYTNDLLTAVPAGFSDPDGDAEGYHYQWYRNGSPIGGATEATLAGTNFSRGDNITVSVTPWDGSREGSAITSGVRAISNTPPTAPVVAISPERAQDDDTLVCGIATASSDADGDTLTYSYSWTRNGSPAGVSTSTVGPAATSNGDTWVCTVTPSDGTDSGGSASDTVAVDDYTPPSAPVLSALYPYQNEDVVVVSGTAEPFTTITLYQGSSSVATTTASGAGTFSFTRTISRGSTIGFYATATDGRGNVSAPSATVSTQACDPWDVYEDTSGYGDSCGDPVEDWVTLPDDGAAPLTITGNILAPGDEDWFVIRTSDASTAGINYYRMRVTLAAGSGKYAFVVYDNGCTTSNLDCPASSSTAPEGSGYTDYEVSAYESGDYSHGTHADRRACGGAAGEYNNCDNLASVYYIKVLRIDRTYSCDYYTLQVSNGRW